MLKLVLSDGFIRLVDFPTPLLKLIQKDDARFFILELDETTAANLRGNIYFPALIRHIRKKTGGRKIKHGNGQDE